MAINSENPIASKNGSPAQICAEPASLATVIFGSNFASLKFASDFEKMNSGAVLDAHTRTHAHTPRAHTFTHIESEESSPVSL